MTAKEILLALKEGKLSTAEAHDQLNRLKQTLHQYPLTEGQKGLWMLQNSEPGMSAYNVPLCFSISGPFDRAAFFNACQLLLRKHPALTAVVVQDKDTLYQKLDPQRQPSVVEEDISILSSEELVPFLKKKIKVRFDLENGPLILFYLLSRSANEHLILIVVHHIVFDGASVVPLLTTLLETYNGHLKGEKVIEQGNLASYAEFVEWEREMLRGEEASQAILYWKKQLSGALPAIEIPTDRPRFSANRYAGETITKNVSGDLSLKLRDLGRNKGINLSVLFFGMWNMLLNRYTEQEDIIVGMPVIGRPEERFEDLIGYFVNMMPVRSKVSETQSLLQYFNDLRTSVVDLLDHQIPFPVLVRELNIPRSGDSAIFQVAFSYQNFLAPTTVTELQSFYGSLSLKFFDEIHQEGEYELVLEVFEQDDDFILNLKFNPDLYDRSTIERMLTHYTTLAQNIVSQPDSPLREYSLLPAEEEQTLLHDWNCTYLEYPDKSFHELFKAQAKSTPTSVAIVHEGRALTYRELDEKSDVIARFLQAQGSGPDVLIGICTDRSLDMMAALLGIFKSGGAYVPLDPDYPDERLRYMIEESRLSLVLTQSALFDKVQRLTRKNVRAVALDTNWDQIVNGASQHGASRDGVGLDHLAYVIYTSGSTGKPKGVMVTHRGLTNFLVSMAREPGLDSFDRLLAVTTYSFDIHGLELYLPLMKGAQCHICSSATARDPDLLMEEIKKARPTIMQATPATWKMLFQSGWKNQERIKVLCGGEALSEALRRQFVETGTELWNMFGPTETTIWSTVKRIVGKEPITIGKPIANTQIFIVDKELKLKPIGIPGELCIAGDGLARGYINQPDLTAQKFVDNPFSLGRKLYFTGDYARWRKDGEIEFLERLDHQVKIRGFRIELGEIETNIRAYAKVNDCAVVVRDHDGNKQLIAYLIARELLNHKEIKEYLKQSLPEYMIPFIFVQIEKLPLTPNGKIDRKELANRPVQRKKPEKKVDKQTNIERSLIEIWEEVLKLSNITEEDAFFETGGDSILAVTMIQRVNKKFGCGLNVTSVFKFPTIKKLSAHISETSVVKCSEPCDVAAIPSCRQATTPKHTAAFPEYYRECVAIVGISCNFPGARTINSFGTTSSLGRKVCVSLRRTNSGCLGSRKNFCVTLG